MKTYIGRRVLVTGAAPGCTETTVVINEDGRQRDLPYVHKFAGDPGWTPPGRLDPTFEWGYAGAGPADTAASILTDHLGYTPLPTIVQRFKADVVGRLDRDGFRLPETEVAGWCTRHADLLEDDRVKRQEAAHWAAQAGYGADQDSGIEPPGLQHQ
jgi:hypothetical protein